MDKFNFYSSSKDTKPGCGTNEYKNSDEKYDKLSKIKNWRRILSNFHEFTFRYNGFTYKTVEHAFQSEKIRLVDETIAYYFTVESNTELGNGSGLDARKARKVKVLSREHIIQWDEIKDEVMTNILISRFNEDDNGKNVLKLTGNAELWHAGPRIRPIRMYNLEDIRNHLF